MKKSILLICLFFIIIQGIAQSEDNKLNNLGLVGELTFYKQSAENHAIRIFNDKVLSDEQKSILLTKYNRVRVLNDQLILQLVSDLLKKKRTSYFKDIDAYFYYGKKQNNKKVKMFITNWSIYTEAYHDMISFPAKPYMDSLIAEYSDLKLENIDIDKANNNTSGNIKVNPTDPLATVGSLFSIYKNIKANNLQNATNIVELLYTLRLPDASQLIADEKELQETKMEPDK
ncbi:MAG: hypothetical protein H7Y00_01325 [Fimbriimonadaceae bacterium]|nr:hypothetical protein [Chitinophagales bacterium]